MYQAHWTPAAGWQGALQPYGPMQIEPSAQVLNYGQSAFEGLKAQRSAKGRVVLFRPEENAARLQAGGWGQLYSAACVPESSSAWAVARLKYSALFKIIPLQVKKTRVTHAQQNINVSIF